MSQTWTESIFSLDVTTFSIYIQVASFYLPPITLQPPVESTSKSSPPQRKLPHSLHDKSYRDLASFSRTHSSSPQNHTNVLLLPVTTSYSTTEFFPLSHRHKPSAIQVSQLHSCCNNLPVRADGKVFDWGLLGRLRCCCWLTVWQRRKKRIEF